MNWSSLHLVEIVFCAQQNHLMSFKNVNLENKQPKEYYPFQIWAFLKVVHFRCDLRDFSCGVFKACMFLKFLCQHSQKLDDSSFSARP